MPKMDLEMGGGDNEGRQIKLQDERGTFHISVQKQPVKLFGCMFQVMHQNKDRSFLWKTKHALWCSRCRIKLLYLSIPTTNMDRK